MKPNMPKLIIKGKYFNEDYRTLQRVLVKIVIASIMMRLNTEAEKLSQKKVSYSHWSQRVLPQRIFMSLYRPIGDSLLDKNNTKEFEKHLKKTLGQKKRKERYSFVALYLGILDRHAVFEKDWETGYISMSFYGATPGHPDARLHVIAKKVLKDHKMLVTSKYPRA